MDRTRADAVDGDALRAQLHCQRPGETGDAGLRRRIGAAQRCCPQAFGGGDIDDARRIGPAQMRQRRPYGPNVGRQQDRQMSLPQLHVVVGVDRREYRDAGIVHQDVDTPELLHDIGENPADLMFITDVEPPAMHLPARLLDLGDHRAEGVLVDVHGRHPSSLVGEQMSGGAAHAATRAGDDGDASLQRSIQPGQSRHDSSSPGCSWRVE